MESGCRRRAYLGSVPYVAARACGFFGRGYEDMCFWAGPIHWAGERQRRKPAKSLLKKFICTRLWRGNPLVSEATATVTYEPSVSSYAVIRGCRFRIKSYLVHPFQNLGCLSRSFARKGNAVASSGPPTSASAPRRGSDQSCRPDRHSLASNNNGRHFRESMCARMLRGTCAKSNAEVNRRAHIWIDLGLVLRSLLSRANMPS